MEASIQDIPQAVRRLIAEKFGRIEEQLLLSGLLDSLQAVELALTLQRVFGLPPNSLKLQDLQTVTGLVDRIVALGDRPPQA